MPTLQAIRSAKGRQVMIETFAQPTKCYGLGVFTYNTGETVVLIRRRRSRSHRSSGKNRTKGIQHRLISEFDHLSGAE
jgi:hypothetical protein